MVKILSGHKMKKYWPVKVEVLIIFNEPRKGYTWRSSRIRFSKWLYVLYAWWTEALAV